MLVLLYPAGHRIARLPPDRPRPHNSGTPASHDDGRYPRRKKARLGCVRVSRSGLQDLTASGLCVSRRARSSENCQRVCFPHLVKSPVEGCQTACLVLLSFGHTRCSRLSLDWARTSGIPVARWKRLAVDVGLRLGMSSPIQVYCPPLLQLSRLAKGLVLRVLRPARRRQPLLRPH